MGSSVENPRLAGEHRKRPRHIRVADRWINPLNGLANEWMNGGRQMQLLLDIDASLPNGTLVALKVLVDTGAQVNLIKERLVPCQFFRRAENPLKLITANSSILEGVRKLSSWV